MMWEKIPCSYLQLNLAVVLGGGQSFRWHKLEGDTWQGVISGLVWSLKQDSSGNLMYYVHNPMPMKQGRKRKANGAISNKRTKQLESDDNSVCFSTILQDYFQLNVNLEELFSQWQVVDENFKKIAKHFPGVRILRQDPTENLVSFICSANNNIPRITSMVEKLCVKYGKEIYEEGGKSFYSFPQLHALAESRVEGELRNMGFGYRAKYINQTAKHITENCSPGWLESLRNVPYEEAHSALTKLSGVGAKVADCVCLMSLDKPCAIPVDTHIWQVTVRDYMPSLKTTKSLTDKIYCQVGDFYREKFGEYAGWANTVLFAADLKQFKDYKRREAT